MVPESVGPYEIIEKIGQGAMGEVFLARDPRLHRKVAIKRLASEPGTDTEDNKQALHEARSVARLNHPNIAAVYDILESDGRAHIVMEYVPGQSLAAMIGFRPMPPAQAVAIGRQIADGLAEAHRAGIIHRDLKPANVVVDSVGHAKILDFGIARRLPSETSLTSDEAQEGSGSSRGDETHPRAGTPAYMAPERFRGEPASVRTDIYSLGVVLYECLTGTRPFAGALPELRQAVLHAQAPSLDAIAPQSPRELNRLVARALERDPTRRYGDAHELSRDLGAVEASFSTASTVQRRWLSFTKARRGSPAIARRRTWLLWATLVAVAAGATLWVVGRPERRAEEPLRFSVAFPPATSLDRVAAGTAIAVSPDGRRVAFVAGGPERPPRLWVRTLDTLSAQRLEGTENAVAPFWSPDARFIGFFSEGRLRKVSVTGGPPEILCDAEFASSGTWSTDGTILFSVFTGPKAGLWRVSGSDTAAARVRTDAGATESWPQFLPDGRHFLFLTGAFAGAGAPTLLHVGSLDSSKVQRLMPVDSSATYVTGGRIIFVRDGSLVSIPFDANRLAIGGEAVPLAETVSYLRSSRSALYSASADGRAVVYVPAPAPSQLTWLDRSGRSVGTVGDPDLIYAVRLSPDGKKIAEQIFDARKGASDIWIDDLERGVRSRLTNDPTNAVYPTWGPRGEQIAFSSGRRGTPQIYVRRPEAGGDERLLLDAPFLQLARDWSPDGQRIVLEDSAPGRRPRHQLWILTLGSPTHPTPFLHGPVNKSQAQFSPDGRFLAFVSEETGRPEVFVASLDGTTYRQVSNAGGFIPRWRRDGKELFFLTPKGQLSSTAVSQAQPLKIGSGQTLFSVSSAAHYLAVRSAGQRYGVDYDVTANGQRFLFILGPDAPAYGSFVVLYGWQRALAR